MLKGKIIKNISNDYTILCDDKKYICKPRGKFRNMKMVPLVGDEVTFDEVNHYILDISKRKNELSRPSISNIDIALIVTSLKKPDLSLNLLDKEISSILLANIEPVICFTKLDLVDEEELGQIKKLKEYYEKINIKVFDNQELGALKAYLAHKTIVLTGQTGAGKSSLLNRLNPTLNLKVGEISTALNRGKHTTRHTEFYLVDTIFIADTPGFSSLDLSDYTKEEIRDSFTEFHHECEFKDCMHEKEQNCEVKKRVASGLILQSRYDHYLNFIK